VEPAGDAMLEGHVDPVRLIPAVPGDDRPGHLPEDRPSSRASIPSGVSANLVTHTIFVSG
jgi:hypothetical protein